MPVDLTKPLDPFQEAVADVANFLRRQTGTDEINLAYCQPNGGGAGDYRGAMAAVRELVRIVAKSRASPEFR
jgi:hypothetical protein